MLLSYEHLLEENCSLRNSNNVTFDICSSVFVLKSYLERRIIRLII